MSPGQDFIELNCVDVKCPCGGEAFKISFTDGTDGKTRSIWLKCTKCHAARVMRQAVKFLDHKET